MNYIFRKSWILIVGFSVFCSILSLLGFFLKDDKMSLIALISFCLFLIAIILLLFWAIGEYLKNQSKSPYVVNFLYFRYTTNDGNFIEYETFKNIQCKRIIMDSINYSFKWSGSKLPEISSNLQTISSKINVNKRDYDNVELKLSQPILLNETDVVHFKAKLDDSDKASATYLETRVANVTKAVLFRVELRYKSDTYSTPAKIARMPIASSTSPVWENIAHTPFVHKVYEYQLVNPEVGYFYRLSWDR
jgi:hypothetical protein